MSIQLKDNKIIFNRTFEAPINEVFGHTLRRRYSNNGSILKEVKQRFIVLIQKPVVMPSLR